MASVKYVTLRNQNHNFALITPVTLKDLFTKNSIQLAFNYNYPIDF